MSRHRARVQRPTTAAATTKPEPVAETAMVGSSSRAEELHALAVARRDARLDGLPVAVPASAPGSPVGSATGAAAGPIRTVVPVAGMTCRSCEVLTNRFVGRFRASSG